MNDKFEIVNPLLEELQNQIKAIPWQKYIRQGIVSPHGWVKIKITDGRPSLINIETSARIEK